MNFKDHYNNRIVGMYSIIESTDSIILEGIRNILKNRKENKMLEKKAKQLQTDFINAVNNAINMKELKEAEKLLQQNIQEIEAMNKPEVDKTVGYYLRWLQKNGPEIIADEKEKIKNGDK